MDGFFGRILFAWIANTIAIGAAVALVGSITAGGLGPILIAGFVFGVVNLLVKPLVTLLALPLVILTFGLALFLVDMAMFALTAGLVDDLDVGGFGSVATGTVIIWLVNLVVYLVASRSRRAAMA